MERYKEKEEEFQKTYKGRISNMFTGIDGVVNFNVELQGKDWENNPMYLQLSPELQRKLDIKGRLCDGMDVIVTTDMDDYVIKINRILH